MGDEDIIDDEEEEEEELENKNKKRSKRNKNSNSKKNINRNNPRRRSLRFATREKKNKKKNNKKDDEERMECLKCLETSPKKHMILFICCNTYYHLRCAGYTTSRQQTAINKHIDNGIIDKQCPDCLKKGNH